MADFAGLTVQVTLKEPPNFVVVGKVVQIVPGKTLTLQDVFFPEDGSRSESWMVYSPTVQDLQVVDTHTARTPTSATPTHAPIPSRPPNSALPQGAGISVPQATTNLTISASIGQPQAVQTNARSVQANNRQTYANGPFTAVKSADQAVNGPRQPKPSPFVDPAILSYGRSPVQTRAASKPPEPSTPVKSMLAKTAESLPNAGSPFIAKAGKSSGSREVSSQSKDVAQPPVGVRQSITVQTQDLGPDGTHDVSQIDIAPKKKARRALKKKNGDTSQGPPPVMNAEVSRNGNDMNGNIKRGKGWRQTPLLQPSPQTSSPHSKGSVRRSRREQEAAKEAQQNGWATEEANDIQDLGDFDFEANHKLFDKKEVFDHLRQGDTTADEDRLVSHNKVHRPGTYGGKNLHPTENVLSPQLRPKHDSNELDSTSDADTELNFANGRSSSKHSATRTSLKKQPSRRNSAQVESKPHPLTASMSSDRAGPAMSRSVTSLSGRPGKSAPSMTTSSMPDRTQSPHSAISTTKSHPTPLLGRDIPEAHLAIHPGRVPCPVLLPSALETLEKETIARYNVTSDAITESAARCIAEMAMSLLSSTPGSRRGSRANTLQRGMSAGLGIDQSPSPVIVILAGNHAIGTRAIAAARQLVCRRTTIIVAEAQHEWGSTRGPEMHAQIGILKRMKGSGASIKRGRWEGISKVIKKLSGPPAIIIDALLGGFTYESLIEPSSPQNAAEYLKETREMIDWANRSRAPVISVGCPSGVSGVDGSTTTVEGEPLAVRPDKVLCLGTPMQGILDAMKGGERWEVSLADIGMNIALRSDEAVAFGAQWVTELKFVEDESQNVETQ